MVFAKLFAETLFLYTEHIPEEHRQHGFFRNMMEKLRSFREIRVQRVLKPDFAKAMRVE